MAWFTRGSISFPFFYPSLFLASITNLRRSYTTATRRSATPLRPPHCPRQPPLGCLPPPSLHLAAPISCCRRVWPDRSDQLRVRSLSTCQRCWPTARSPRRRRRRRRRNQAAAGAANWPRQLAFPTTGSGSGCRSNCCWYCW